MKISPSLIWCAFITLATLDATSAASMRFYKGAINDYIETPINDLSKMYSYIDKQKNITIYTAGYQHQVNSTIILEVLSSFISRNTTNVMLLDWEKESQGEDKSLGNSSTAAATASARQLGLEAGEGLTKLIEDISFLPDNVRMFGFSLGAHLMGWTGKEMMKKGYCVSRIIGIDAADPSFDSLVASDGLNPTRAQLVIGLHSNIGGLGSIVSVGSIDFWANCGNNGLQPGCAPEAVTPPSKTNQCSHGRAMLLTAECLRNPTAFPAVRASSCSEWKCQTSTNAVINYYSDDLDPSLTGNFYFSTNSASPYSKGQNGLRPNE